MMLRIATYCIYLEAAHLKPEITHPTAVTLDAWYHTRLKLVTKLINMFRFSLQQVTESMSLKHVIMDYSRNLDPSLLPEMIKHFTSSAEKIWPKIEMSNCPGDGPATRSVEMPVEN